MMDDRPSGVHPPDASALTSCVAEGSVTLAMQSWSACTHAEWSAAVAARSRHTRFAVTTRIVALPPPPLMEVCREPASAELVSADAAVVTER